MERESKENEKKENGKKEDENGKMKRVSESVDPAKVPKRTLFTGKEIPAVGIGTFGSDKYGAEEIADAGDCRNCEGSWGTSSDHLYQMGCTERTDPHSVFCQATTVSGKPAVCGAGSADGG